MSKKHFENVIFDLDGTLVDSVPGIRASLEIAIASLSLSLSLDNLRLCLGPPLRQMIFKMWPHLDSNQVESLVRIFRENYNTEGCLNTRLYPGMSNEIVQLSQDAVQLFILTNKPHEPTGRILHKLEITRFFRAVHSPDSVSGPFHVKEEGATQMASRYKLIPENTLLIGDSNEDRDAAEAAGFSFLRAAYGYGTFNAEFGLPRWPTLSAPSELPHYLKKEIYK